MNILFIESSIPPTRGGVQRVSWIISHYFNAHGYDSFFAFWCEDTDEINDWHKVRIGVNDKIENCEKILLNFIKQRNINLIINQQTKCRQINKILKKVKKEGLCKIIYCLHLSPNYSDYWGENNLSYRIKNLFIKICTGMNILDYSELCQYKISDRYVLLSETFITEFIHRMKIKDGSKIRCICNPLSFPEYSSNRKRLKQVLIISRMDERQKNITTALRMWKEIENRGHKDWHLVMGGYGDDEKMILDYAKSLGIERMRFIGKITDPRNLYLESAIFLMTSNYEGFGMVLTEAIQFGCVPLAFDTYTALHDILEDGYNGYIIPCKDEKTYVDKLESLMLNPNLIKKLSINAMKSSKKFSIDVIGQKWLNLINEFNDDI